MENSLYHSTEKENIRLRFQNEILKDLYKNYFINYIQKDFSILDIGCASADNIIMRLEDIEYKNLLGLDIEDLQIKNANANYGSNKNKFIQCNVLDDSFDDVISKYLKDNNIVSFDLIHISSVLLHLSNPIKLLSKIKKYLSDDGYLFIQEEDDGKNIVKPESEFFDLAFKIWADSKESGDRYCAKSIPKYLKDAGYSKVQLACEGPNSEGLSKDKKDALWNIYFNYNLWLALDDENMFYHYDKIVKYLEKYKKLYNKVYNDYMDGKIFIQLGFLFFIVQK